MKFENYARDWLERQTLSKSMRKTTRQSVDYICRGIGELELSAINEADIDRIFTDVHLFRRWIDFMERTFRVMNSIFAELIERGLVVSDPCLRIYEITSVVKHRTIGNGNHEYTYDAFKAGMPYRGRCVYRSRYACGCHRRL